jgi:hypothetical protein
VCKYVTLSVSCLFDGRAIFLPTFSKLRFELAKQLHCVWVAHSIGTLKIRYKSAPSAAGACLVVLSQPFRIIRVVRGEMLEGWSNRIKDHGTSSFIKLPACLTLARNCPIAAQLCRCISAMALPSGVAVQFALTEPLT